MTSGNNSLQLVFMTGARLVLAAWLINIINDVGTECKQKSEKSKVQKLQKHIHKSGLTLVRASTCRNSFKT